MKNKENGQVSLFDYEEFKELKPKIGKDWRWAFKDYPAQGNGLKVFTCFSCGGGSTMGYKLAGCDVIGNCEIDPKMNELYVLNHKPKYSYLLDIREFNKLENLPHELYELDILDGSPPCTTFSMAGNREESWGQKKKFREGQTEQTLDDLSFVFIQTAIKLKPKVVIMENVEGLTLGNAWSYVQNIYCKFKEANYRVHHWLCKGEDMGIPQARHRVFFVAIRNDLEFDPKDIDMSFNYEPIPFKEIKSGLGYSLDKSTKTYRLLCEVRPGEKSLCHAHKRLYGKSSWFQPQVIYDDEVMPTIRARTPDVFRFEDKSRINEMDVIHSQTFPEDYDFITNTLGNISYVCGMSVPPVMMKRVVNRVIESGVFRKAEQWRNK